MANIEKKLKIWLEQGLISAEQLQSISQYEEVSASDNSSSWWLYSLLILGTSIIGLGIISLIAANWALIPDLLKLAADFLLLAVLAVGIFYHYGKPQSRWLDALICGFIVLCLATIGLIAQIYQLSGHWYHALLLWSAITLPIVLFARQLFIYFLWATLFLHACVWSGVSFASGDITQAYEKIPALFLFSPLLAATCYSLTQISQPLKHFQSSFFFWFQVSGLIALVVIDVMRSGGEMREYELAWYIPAYISAAILTIIILIRPDYKALNKSLLIGIIVLLLLYYHPYILFDGNTRYGYDALQQGNSATFWTADDIRAPFLTIFILFLYATHAGNSGHHKTFNLITFLIGLRFVILYFQAMGGLAATGVGLIMSGLMIIGIAWFWYKSRGRLRRWSEELHE
ncbi:MAG: DUF2157 domain-containing protein [Thiolinea sp.]